MNERPVDRSEWWGKGCEALAYCAALVAFFALFEIAPFWLRGLLIAVAFALSFGAFVVGLTWGLISKPKTD